MKVALLLILAGTCLAQDAQVYDLQPTETAEGKRLYKEMNDSKKAYDDWVEKTGAKYLLDKDNADWAVAFYHENGHAQATFDGSFKHVLPKTYVIQATGGGSGCFGCVKFQNDNHVVLTPQ